MKKIISIVVLLLIAAGLVYYFGFFRKSEPLTEEQNQMSEMLKIETLKEGTGQPIENGQTAVVHYTGWLTNGTKFDSSVDRGTPFSFTLGEGKVIIGWEQGILGMKVGEKRKLTIAPELGYGPQAVGGVIPANSTLIFEVELLEIN
jgi:FKBP-type peptidyl-prolyl cis-trans isomerase